MPLYEYVCRKCRTTFGEAVTIKEHETRQVSCPKCKSADLEKVLDPNFVKTTSETDRP
jgi:putative FmdB family regulatory protein